MRNLIGVVQTDNTNTRFKMLWFIVQLFLYFAAVASTLLVIFTALILVSDTDLTLGFCEKFGAKPSSELRGKVIWLTGASSGIGEQLAYQLARCGCKLVLSSRRKDELERVKQKCIDLSSRYEDFFVLPLDLAEHESHKALMQEVLNKFGQVDILLNNAGFAMLAEVTKTSFAGDKKIILGNLLGTMSLTKSVLPHMIERRSGHIVCVTALVLHMGFPRASSSMAAKNGLHGFFEVLRNEVASSNITVTFAMPGAVTSNAVKNAMMGDVDTKYDGPSVSQQGVAEMSAERCAHLITVTLANKLEEVWLSPNPILGLAYIAQHSSWLVSRLIQQTMSTMFDPGDAELDKEK